VESIAATKEVILAGTMNSDATVGLLLMHVKLGSIRASSNNNSGVISIVDFTVRGMKKDVCNDVIQALNDFTFNCNSYEMKCCYVTSCANIYFLKPYFTWFIHWNHEITYSMHSSIVANTWKQIL